MVHDTKQNQSLSSEESTHYNIVNVLRKISHVGVHIPYTHLEEDESTVATDEQEGIPPESPEVRAITVRERKISNNRAINAKYLDGTKVENLSSGGNETPLKYVEINCAEKETTLSDLQILPSIQKKNKIFGGLMAAPVRTNPDKYLKDDESITSNSSNDDHFPNSIYKNIFTPKGLAGLVFVLLVVVTLTWTLLSE